MSPRRQGLARIWPDGSPLVGMVHLLPLPGAPTWRGSMDAVVERALGDAGILSDEGYDGIIVENFADTPFFGGRVPPETVAAMARATAEVVGATALPVGVNVLRNDARAALAVAAATEARFIRVNVHTGSMWTDQGLVEGRAAETLRAREALSADVAVLADVHVKHAAPPAGQTIGAAAADAWRRGRADALIVSGSGTGEPIEKSDVAALRAAVPEATVLAGSGTTPETIRSLLAVTDGVIVGSAIMRDGRAGTGVDRGRAAALIAAARG